MKKVLTIGFLSFLTTTSIFAYLPSRMAELNDQLQKLNSTDCQIDIEKTSDIHNNENLLVKLLNRKNGQTATFKTLDTNPKMQLSKTSSGSKLSYSDVIFQDASFGSGLQEYKTLIVETDSNNNIESITFTNEKDVRGMWSVKKELVKSFKCQN